MLIQGEWATDQAEFHLEPKKNMNLYSSKLAESKDRSHNEHFAAEQSTN